MWNDTIIFEQPLNEHMRACLRLEHLFSQIQQTIDQPSEWASRSCLHSLLKILNVVDRPDLKNKFTKALSDHASVLTQLERNPQVDSTKLRVFLDQLDALIDQLYAMNGKIGQCLGENDFLAGVRSHMNNPGGPCNFSIPSYQLWLNQPDHQRSQDLQRWHDEFAILEKAVQLLLQLTREFTKPNKHLAEGGFYQQALDSNSHGEMVRVIVPSSLNIFPEISVGRHRLSVRFYQGDLLQKPRQTSDAVQFVLMYSSL